MTGSQGRIVRVLSALRYKGGWKISWTADKNGNVMWCYWSFDRPDRIHTDEMDTGMGATFFVDVTMSEEGIVRKCFQEVLHIEEHEAREFFMYDDQRPFDPHVSLIKPLL